jgi:UDP-N-acetylglucosamine 1-carboxyvinyltransferase
VRNDHPQHFDLIDRTFAKFGVEVVHENGWSHTRQNGPLKVVKPFTSNILTKVEAAPWPYLPVDLLPLFIALGVKAEGNTMFWNNIYDGAMGWSSELSKFGAHVFLGDPHRLITFGGLPLSPASVESPYIIRVAIALFMVAASIEGRSEIRNALPIRRAHPKFVENLRSLGAVVDWVEED